jgi:hypothetical protein
VAGDSPAAAVLAALSAEPAGVTVAVIAAPAGISTADARQSLAAHENAGAATRVKRGRPGIPDTWKRAPHDEAPPAEDPGTDTVSGGEPTADGAADAGLPASVHADGTTAAKEAEAGAAQGQDPAIAEAASAALVVAKAADTAGKALAAGDLNAALAALDTAREQAAQGRRVLKAVGRGRRAPATRPGGLRDLVEQHLRKFPDAAFTPHQVGKVLARSSGAVANALDKLVSPGVAELACDKPRSYRLAPATGPKTADDPGTSGQATASAA